MQEIPYLYTEQTLAAACKDLLLLNARDGGFTVPTTKLYPFQWLWDSGFIAIGLAHFDRKRAMREIDALHSAQWSNGFVPHIVFHTLNDGYFPGPEVHGAYLSPNAPQHVSTTGITQPPVIGFVLEKIAQLALNDLEVTPFLEEHFEKTYRFHEYLYRDRDPLGEGLVYIQHNWESGTDNSPVWDEVWKTFEAPNYELPRRDIQHVNADQRPTHRDYEYYIYLIEFFKSVRYDDGQIAAECPFLIQDPLFNAMLAASNEALARVGKLIGASEDKINQLLTWYERTKEAMNQKLWSEAEGVYQHYDLRNGCMVNAITSSSFAPLFAGIPDPQKAKRLEKILLGPSFMGQDRQNYLCPSFNVLDSRFNPMKYWRGPVWVNMNWLIYHGLKRYHLDDSAEVLLKDTIELVKRYGLWEYFDPERVKSEKEVTGYGAPDFSWTAALILDLLQH